MPLEPLVDDRPFFDRVSGAVKGFLISFFLFTTLIVFNLTQVASLVVAVFSSKAFRAYNRWAADFWWGLCVSCSRSVNGAKLILSGNPVPVEENAIVLCNHQQMPDITFLFLLAKTKHRLGDLKWIVKDIIKWVPGVGWGLAFVGSIFVSRNWTNDRASIERTFSSLIRNRVPFWVMMFVEGTRVTSEKIKGSREYALKKNMQPLDHLLFPRTKGFVASVQGLRNGHLDAVYDITIGYEKGVPTLWQYIKGAVRVAHFHVRRYPVKDLPGSQEELSKWLIERFTEKDRLLDHFYHTGSFAGSTPTAPNRT